MQTAEESRNLAFNYLKNKPNSLLNRFFNEIEYQSKLGRFEFNFHTDGEHFTRQELEIIRGLGYSIDWNSPCLWYEVSW